MQKTCGLKRLLMTTDAVGGVWQYSVDLAGSLATRGTEVLLAVIGPSPSEQQKAQLSGVDGVRMVGRNFALEWMSNPWEDVDRTRNWLGTLERQFRPDAIHLNSYALAGGEWRTPVVVAAHSCVYSWWRAVHRYPPDSNWEEYKTRVACGLKDAVAVVAPSRFMADALASEYNFCADKVQVIHNFSLARLPKTVPKRPYLLAAGRIWDKAKNLALLDSAALDVEWPLYIAGSNEGEETLKSNGGARWLGNLPHLKLLAYMTEASIFIHPALYEPFGLAVLEAARTGCCLVLADIPSMHELWNGAAAFVNPADEAAWTEQVNLLIHDDEKRMQLGALAAQKAKRYRAAASVSRYIVLYETAISGKCTGNGVAA
jgi:glycogen synthase